MYRHHDHLHSWVSGFQKVHNSKDDFYVSVSVKLHPSFILQSYGASSVDVELWGGGRVPPNYCSAVLCSSTVCVYEMQKNSSVRLFS